MICFEMTIASATNKWINNTKHGLLEKKFLRKRNF
uniref:Bm13569 n=1 Tax=Brugia malayi TaxID=6279 RepID=A0A1I9G5A2_BRUMA|nr:Bm13569 [Brugia malayi]